MHHCHVQQYSLGTIHYIVESKISALHVVEPLVYVRVDNISIVDLAHLAVLKLFHPRLVRMHYARSPWISCFLKLSCVRYAAS